MAVEAPQEFAATPHELPGVGTIAATPPAPGDEAARVMRELLVVNRDLAAATRALVELGRHQAEVARQQAEMVRQQLELAKRAEQRVEEQRQAQRDEFQRWLGEYGLLGGRSGRAEKTIRVVLGRAMAELVDYIEENDESLPESEFVRREMADRYGSLLAHLWSIHGILKHLSAAEQAGAGPAGGAGDKPAG